MTPCVFCVFSSAILKEMKTLIISETTDVTFYCSDNILNEYLKGFTPA